LGINSKPSKNQQSSWKNWHFLPNCLTFQNFENHGYIPNPIIWKFWKLTSGYIPGLITDGHLSLILRIARHRLTCP
jgi:hypothetical protein